MIKNVTIWGLLVLIISACATTRQTETAQPQINFAIAKSILNQFKHQQEVLNRFGDPSKKSPDQSGGETWNYNQATTGYQRLTITFGADKVIQSVLWIPDENEQEAKLGGVLSQYGDLKIIPIETREVAPPHDLNTETVYSDSKTISILHNDYLKRVEAIGWFVSDNKRLPSSTLKMKKRRLVNF